ncbi:hypothetical protein L6164_005570 [Bauhinia variegata]|uniref:Uncharacterized protein n=1 Tax=Bauhinia variegata TaxID=167791 RepID=A0ACB9PRQ3_BAUVA|nr:hypothetical protein L6164_005570 [Bauhinia variegata]
MLIVTDKLSGANYREWAQAVKLAIGGRGKMEFLTGAATIPTETDTQAAHQWHTENLMVSSQLINAMVPEIKRSFMFLPTAHDIWEVVRDSYYDGEDMSRLFEIQTKIWELKQGDREVTAYWLEISALWQELDLMATEEWNCAHDAALHKGKIKKERVFQFLAGLNKSLDDVRSGILSPVPLPSIREVFSEVRREASRRKIMPQEGSSIMPPMDSTALASRISTTNGKGQKGRPTRDHCKKTSHTSDVCWDLHGKPADWKPRKGKPRGYQASRQFPRTSSQFFLLSDR